MKRMKKLLTTLLLGIALVISTLTPVSANTELPVLPLNGSVTGEITKDREQVAYQLTLKEAGTITFDFLSSIDASGRYALQDEWNNTLFSRDIKGSASSPGRDVVAYDLEKGKYQLVVFDASRSRYSQDIGTFKVTTSFKAVGTNDVEPNNGTVEAQALPFGKKLKGFLSVQDSKDVYQVTLTKAGRLTLDLTSYIDTDTQIQLFDAYNQSIYSDQLRGSSKTPSKFFHQVDLEPGKYYFQVSDSYRYQYSFADTGVYEVKADFKPAMNTELEPNNGQVEAKPFPLFTTVKGALSWNDAEDVYKVSLPKASTVGIDLTSYISNAAYIALYHEQTDTWLLDGEYVTSAWNQPGRYKQQLSLGKGTYYVHVYDPSRKYSSSYRTGTYQLRLTSSHLLPVLSVNKVTKNSGKVTGKTEKGATVSMTLGKNTYTRKADSKGNYSFAIKKQKVGTSIKLSSKNKYGSSVKTIKVSK